MYRDPSGNSAADDGVCDFSTLHISLEVSVTVKMQKYQLEEAVLIRTVDPKKIDAHLREAEVVGVSVTETGEHYYAVLVESLGCVWAMWESELNSIARDVGNRG